MGRNTSSNVMLVFFGLWMTLLLDSTNIILGFTEKKISDTFYYIIMVMLVNKKTNLSSLVVM